MAVHTADVGDPGFSTDKQMTVVVITHYSPSN